MQQERSTDYQPLDKAQGFIDGAIQLLGEIDRKQESSLDAQEEEWVASAREQILTAQTQLDLHIAQLETSPDSTFFPALTQAAATLYTAVETLNQLWAKVCCHTQMTDAEMPSAGRARTYSTMGYVRLSEHARDLGISLPELPDPPVSLPPLLQAIQERNSRLDTLCEEVMAQYPPLLELSANLDEAISAIEILWEKSATHLSDRDDLIWLANARAAAQASRCQMEGLVLVLAGDLPDEFPATATVSDDDLTTQMGSYACNLVSLPATDDDTPA